MNSFSELVGRILSKIEGKKGDERINFHCANGEGFQLFHEQDCCESVTVQDICGDLNDLIGWPILQAEESTGPTPKGVEEPSDSYTWTFYRLATIKGAVTIRWLGESNGYYSESVTFEKI